MLLVSLRGPKVIHHCQELSVVLCQAVHQTLLFIPIPGSACCLASAGGSRRLCEHILLFMLRVKWHLPFGSCTG